MQNDDELFMPLAANEIWLVKLFLLYSGGGTTNLKIVFSGPAACEAFWGADGAGNNTLGTSWGWVSTTATAQLLTLSSGVALEFGIAGVAAYSGILVTLLARNGANAGNLQLRWAQSTAAATDSTVRKDSLILAHKLN